MQNKVPGAWLVQIKDAGHAVPNQYPEEVGNDIANILVDCKVIGDQAGKKNPILIFVHQYRQAGSNPYLYEKKCEVRDLNPRSLRIKQKYINSDMIPPLRKGPTSQYSFN